MPKNQPVDVLHGDLWGILFGVSLLATGGSSCCYPFWFASSISCLDAVSSGAAKRRKINYTSRSQLYPCTLVKLDGNTSYNPVVCCYPTIPPFLFFRKKEDAQQFLGFRDEIRKAFHI